MRSVQTAPKGQSIWHTVKQDTFVNNVHNLLLASNAIAGDPKTYQEETWRQPQLAGQALNYILPFRVEHQFADDLAFLAAAQEGAGGVSAATISEDIGGHGCTVKLTANEGVPAAVASAFREMLSKLQKCARKGKNTYWSLFVCKTLLNSHPEMSYEVCEESLFEISIKLSKKRIYARLQSSKWKKPLRLRAVEQEPLTEKLLASSKRILKVSTSGKNKNRLQDITCKIKALHELYLNMEKETTDKDTHFLKQIVRQASGLSAPASSLETSLIASGVSPGVANSNLVRRVDKLGRYWAACATMAKLASNPKYRTLFASVKLETVPAYRAHIWPPGSDKRRHVHAEVQLVTHHRLHPSGLPPRVIGISKAACYLCDLFLSKHKQYYFSGSHGTIFDAWTVPDLVEYSVSDITELRQIMVVMNRNLYETEQRIRKPRAKRQSTGKQLAYQSFIWSTPYQASTPPLSTRDEHSVPASVRSITPGLAGPSAHVPPFLPQISQDEGDATDNGLMQIAQAKSPNQASIEHSTEGIIAPTNSTHTTVHRDSDRQHVVNENRLAATFPLPESNGVPAAGAQPSHESKPPTPSDSEAKTLAHNSHIGGSEPRDSHLHEHSYAAPPSKDRHDPAAAASAIRWVPSNSGSSSSEIIISPNPKTITTRRPRFASLPGMDLYFSLEASPSVNVLAEPISSATVALTEMPFSDSLPGDGRSTSVDVAAMALGEELVLEASTDGTGGGLVEMQLRNSRGGEGAVRVICEWIR